MKKIFFSILSLTIATLCVFAAPKKEKAKVLIIGDSISMGYNNAVAENLKDIATVLRCKGNAQATKNALEPAETITKGKKKAKPNKNTNAPTRIESYIGDTKWNVIHFNYGLHDLCYRHPSSKLGGNRDKINGVIAVSLEDYKANLQKIIDILKTTDAKLIFATTTHVPAGEAGRFPEDVFKYNDAAIEVMQKNNVIINPLHPLSVKIHKEHGIGDTNYIDKEGDEYKEVDQGNVHYDKEGSKILGAQVSDYIRQALAEEPACE